MNIVTIDFDIIMEPSINLYNDKINDQKTILDLFDSNLNFFGTIKGNSDFINKIKDQIPSDWEIIVINKTKCMIQRPAYIKHRCVFIFVKYDFDYVYQKIFV